MPLPGLQDLAVQAHVPSEPPLLRFRKGRSLGIDELDRPLEERQARFASEHLKDQVVVPEDALGLVVGIANFGEQAERLVRVRERLGDLAGFRVGKSEMG